MKHLALILVATLLLNGCASLPVISSSEPLPTPHTATDTVLSSIVRLTRTRGDRVYGICTAFAIAPKKFMTAAHCVGVIEDPWEGVIEGVDIRLNNVVAFVVRVDVARDLALLLADTDLSALGFREEPLSVFEEVNAAGFGNGFTRPLVTTHIVQLLEYSLEDEDEKTWPGTVFLHPFIHGMSGGPVFDKQGSIVGVVQRGGGEIAYAVSVQTIKEFMR